jgi:hypothetical protein
MAAEQQREKRAGRQQKGEKRLDGRKDNGKGSKRWPVRRSKGTAGLRLQIGGAAKGTAGGSKERRRVGRSKE